MTFQERKWTDAALLCAILAVFPFFVACGGDNPETQDRMVQVNVTDQELQMPESLPTGATTFQITNAGNHEHSFGIAGPAGDMKLDKTLKPGETATLDMALEAGTYRVYCPVDESHGKPLQLALHVVQAPAAVGSKS